MVRYILEGEGEPSFVNDASGVSPIIPLTPDPRTPLGMVYEPTGGLRFSEGRLEASVSSSVLFGERLLASGAFTVIAKVEADNIFQSGPSRIVTYSSSTGQRGFTLGHEKAEFRVRIRTSVTNGNGTSNPTGEISMGLSAPAFPTSGPTQLAAVWDGETGTAQAYVDADLVDEQEHLDDMEDPAELEWETDVERLALGDEFWSGDEEDRIWEGLLHEVAIFDSALSATEIADWFAASF